MSTVIPRGRYQGMLQILGYNLRFYLLSAFAAGLAAWAVLAFALPAWLAGILVLFASVTLLLGASSLLASHYLYDRSDLLRFEWLRLRVDPPGRWTLLHAGLDEASPALRQLFPAANADILDIFDPAEMPEPSIARARRLTPPPEPARPASFAALPLPDGATGLLVLFFVAHELRRREARERLFREVRRILAPGGRVVLVEQLRDGPNLLAFGPGFFHFLPRAEWLRLARFGGLAVREECRITPFVRAFFMEAIP
jgi:SAM-dependent methyltransferase